MKCVTVCYNGDLYEVIVCSGVMYTEGFCALMENLLGALCGTEAVLCWMLNGREARWYVAITDMQV